MTENPTPRTWTLGEGAKVYSDAGTYAVLMCEQTEPAPFESVVVIDIDPVADLLVRLIDTQSTTHIETWSELYEDAAAILKALGRKP